MAEQITTTISTISGAPDRDDPDNFNSESDAFFEDLPAAISDINDVADEMNAVATEVESNATAAESAKDSAVAASNATIYSAGSTYTAGQQIIFTDGFSYTCITATSAGESPTTHPAKWQQITLGPKLFEEKTTSFTAAYGGNYILMNTSGATVTLPATVSASDPITLVGGLSALTNNVTVARNGNTIGRLSEDLTIDDEYYRIEFTPIPSTSDWQIGGSIS